jgi:hypothetical protein
MNQAELRDLAAQLARAGALARHHELDTAGDYERASELTAALADRLPAMSAEDRERIDLNADLPQLAFHLGEELRRADDLDRDALAGSLTFMRRHLVRIEAEWVDRAYLRLDPLDRELMTGLARLARDTYERRWAPFYADAGYRRPWVDKLYRDYALTAIPDGLLAELAHIAGDRSYDAILCVLKGGLPYTLLIELIGTTTPIRHVMCGRAGGSHVTPDYVVRPLDFDWSDLAGKRVLVVDNNAATGATLRHLGRELHAVPGLRAELFLDYVVTAFAALDPAAFADLGFAATRIGPFTDAGPQTDRKRHVVSAIGKGLRGAKGFA